MHPHPPQPDLSAERLISSEQQLLTRRSARIKSTRDLRSSERAVGQHSPVLPGKGHPLGHTLVDDVDADFRQPIDVCFPGAKITAFDGVLKKPPHRIPVILVILRRIDPSLRGNGVCSPGTVLKTEGFHPVAELRQAGGGRGPGQTRPDHNHLVLALVGRTDQTNR